MKKTAVQVIREIERDADNDAIYCVGDSLANRIIDALELADYEVVPKNERRITHRD